MGFIGALNRVGNNSPAVLGLSETVNRFDTGQGLTRPKENYDDEPTNERYGSY